MFNHSGISISSWALLVLFLPAAGIALAAFQGPPRPFPALEPGDHEVVKTVSIEAAHKSYTLTFRGTVDGVMTRMPISYGAYHAGWQPNRFVRLENVGETDVVNPWLVVNGRRNWQTLESIVAEGIAGCQTDAEKAQALWELEKHSRFHACTWDGECSDAVKVYNVYGYTLCGNDAQVLSDLWKAAGLTTRRGYPIGHCVAEAFFDNAFHLLDGDEHVMCLKYDNRTIASCAEIVRDHELMKRTHTYSIGANEDNLRDQFSASLYWYEGERHGSHGGHTKHAMHYTLRPGEAIEWRWDHVGKQYTAGVPSPDGKHHKDGQSDLLEGWGKVAYAKMCNGRTHYQPALARKLYRAGVASERNIACTEDDQAQPALHPAQPGRPAEVVWRIHSPYVIVGGKVALRGKRAEANDMLKLSLSRDRKQWQPLWTADQTGLFDHELVFDEHLSPRAKPQYEYYLKVELQAARDRSAVGLESIVFDTDLQMALLSLPELEDHPCLGRADHLASSGGAAGADPSAGRRDHRGHQSALSVAAALGSRRRQDRGLSHSGLRERGPALAAVAQLQQAQLQDALRWQAGVDRAVRGPAQSRHNLLLAGAGQRREGRLGALERALVVPVPGARRAAGPPSQVGRGHWSVHLDVEAEPSGTQARAVQGLRQ